MAGFLVSGSLAFADADIIIDNADSAHVTVTGTWTTSTASSQPYGANYLHDGNAGKGSKSVAFAPTIAVAGTYEVYVWTPESSTYAKNVPVDVFWDGGTSTVQVDESSGGGRWKPLGAYNLPAGSTAKVVIRNGGTSNTVVADAVKFRRVGVIDAFVDNSQASLTGAWTASTYYTGYYGADYLHDDNTGKGTKTATFSKQLPATGDYEVYLRWISFSDRATNVPVDIHHANGTATVHVNQQQNGSQWNLLGRYFFRNDTPAQVVVNTTGTSGFVIADAVRFTQVGQVLDNAAPSGVTLTGSWLSSTYTVGYYGIDYLQDNNIDKGSKQVRFAPSLSLAGDYSVYLRWSSGTNRSSTVPVDVHYNGGTDLLSVNQQANGDQWVYLGTYPFLAGTAGNLVIGNAGTSGFVIADAIQMLPLDNDWDGIPDAWENLHGLNPESAADASQDSDGDGISNLLEYRDGTDPQDYYNGQVPTLTKSGDNQSGPAGTVLPAPLAVTITTSAGAALNNAPVTFSVIAGGGQIATSSTGMLADTQPVWTSSSGSAAGTAAVYLVPGGGGNTTNQVQASVTVAGVAHTVTFTATTTFVPQIDGGDQSTVVLKSDGTVWAWGANQIGQLGDGTTVGRSQPVQITKDANDADFTGIKAIACGPYHTLALKNDGTVWAWGSNYRGELGNGTEGTGGPWNRPVEVQGLFGGFDNPLDTPALNPVIAIAAGPYYSMALKADGTVWEWGTPLNFAFVHEDRLTPMPVLFEDNTQLANIKAIAAGGWHALALANDGTVWAWGQNPSGELGNGTTEGGIWPGQVTVNGVPLNGVTAIRAGYGDSLALKDDGSISAWGLNYAGLLGDGSLDGSLEPVAVAGFGPANSSTRATQIAEGAYHNLARCADGRVWTWGENISGELGRGTVNPYYHSYAFPEDHAISPPELVPAPITTLSDISWVGGSSSHSFAIDASGRVWAWGENDSGELGLEHPLPMSSPAVVVADQSGAPFNNVKSLVSGPGASMALKNDGTVWAWGYNGNALLGNGAYVNTSQPVQVPGLANVRQITSDGASMFAVDSNNNVWSWGEHPSDEGALYGTNVPDLLTDPGSNQLTAVQKLSAQGHVALKTNSTVWTWEDGGAFSQITTDTIGTALASVTDVSGDQAFGLARKSDGSVWAWGENDHGQLGSNLFPAAHVAVQVPGLGTYSIVKVSAGSAHGLALDDHGQVWTWGSNESGQYGNGMTSAGGPTAVRVGGLDAGAAVVDVYATYSGSLALKSDGTVWAWGDQASTPHQLAGFEGVAVLGDLAVKFDGTIASQGINSDGDLGIGGVTATPVPKAVGGINVFSDSPSVSMTSSASSIALGDSVTLQATSFGTVSKVTFYNEGTEIGEVTGGATSFTWTPPSWGNYHLCAVVTGSTGLMSSLSQSVTLTVERWGTNPTATVMPDAWQTQYFGHTGVDPNGDADGDGLTNLQEYQSGSSPTDYFSQNGHMITPRIFVYGGGGAWVENGHYSDAPITYKVIDADTKAALGNAPVTVFISRGKGAVATAIGGSAQTPLSLRSDSAGLVKVYFKAPTP